jgi:hypothetical protein
MENKYKWPIYITLILSAGIITVSRLYESTLSSIIILSCALFLLTVLLVMCGFLIKQFRPWILPIICSLLIYAGAFILMLSMFKETVTDLRWDPNMVGLGIVLFGLAFAFLSQSTLLTIERIVRKIPVKPGDIIESKDINTIDKPILITPVATDLIISTYPPSFVINKNNKEEAQQRLDEDTKKAGYQRGEIYPIDKESWGIKWGGKYSL